MSSIQTNLLADMIESTRDLVSFYTRNIPKENWHHHFEMQNKRFNSIAWQLAHLAWAQNLLILKATGGPIIEKDWFEDFAMGKPSPTILPILEEIEETLNEVHMRSVKHVRQMNDEQLGEQNTAGLKLKIGSSNKAVIMHHVRHEGTHIGQLAWLAKMHDVKTI